MSMLQSIIFGFGHCGRNLHWAALRALHRDAQLTGVQPQVSVVDPAHAGQAAQTDAVRWWPELPPVQSVGEQSAVVHICTPPALHLSHVRLVLERGYRYLILEKPMVMDLAEADQLLELERRFQAQILVVSVWSFSALMPRLTQWLQGREQRLRRLHIIHHKPRFSRSLARAGEHLFDIEMPHQVSLALVLAGAPAMGMQAWTRDLQVAALVRPAMHSGGIAWLTAQGTEVHLESDLASPIRQRSVRLELDDEHACEGFFPVSADDSHAQFCANALADVVQAREVFADAPLTACLQRYYQHFSAHMAGAAPIAPPGSSVAFNREVVALLEQARRQVGASLSVPKAKEASQ